VGGARPAMALILKPLRAPERCIIGGATGGASDPKDGNSFKFGGCGCRFLGATPPTAPNSSSLEK